MYFEIEPQNLTAALSKIIGVVGKGNVYPPILHNILIACADNALTLIASDSEVEVAVVTPLEPRLSKDDDGAVTVPGHKLFSICRSLSSGVKFTKENEGVTLRSGRSRFSLGALAAEGYPVIGSTLSDLIASFSINAAKLNEIISQTLLCAAMGDVRYYLNGLLFELTPEKFVVVGTDGHRLAYVEHEMQTGVSEPVQIIVPHKAVAELMRNLGKAESIIVSASRNLVRFEGDNYTMTAKLIDGRFPDYHGVMPAYSDKIVTADSKQLKQSLARVSILSNEKYKGVRLKFKNGLLIMSARNPEQEEAEEELAIEYEGEEFEIGFNTTYLSDALGAVKSEQVQLLFSEPSSSCVVKPIDSDRQKYIVMPMRL